MAEIENLVISVNASADSAQRVLDGLAASLGNVGRVSRKVSTELKPVVSDTQDVASKTEVAGRSIDTFGDNVQASVSSLSAFSMVLKSIGNTGNAAFNAISAIPKALGGEFIGNIKSAVTGLGNFLNSIKRIAMYRLIRTALKEITQGFAEGQKALYAWSSANGDQFAKSMDRIATAAQYLRNSLAAMAAPIYNALAPAIDFIVDKFVAMFNTVNQLFARLAGQTTYTAAKKVAAKWDDASKSASKTAKELKRTILSFDEINRLSKDTSAAGGSGSAADSGAGMFETKTIDGQISTFADQLKKAFNTGDWKQLGQTIGKKINEAIGSVDWAGIGRKVGEWINGWFTTKYWTLDTINFNNIGGRIAEFFNNAMAKIDFGIIGRTLVQKLTIVWDMVLGFFTNLDWGMAARKIGDFVKGIYTELTKWFQSYDWGNIGTVLYNKLKDALTNFDFAGIAKSFMTFLGSAVRAIISAGAGFVGGFWTDIASYWNKNIKGETFTQTVHNLLNAIGYGLGQLPVWVWNNIVKPFSDALLGEGGLEKIWKSLKQTASNVWGTIKATILSAWNAITGKVKSVWTGITDTIQKAWETVKSVTSTTWTNLKSSVTQIWEDLKRSATEKWEMIKNIISTVWNDLKVWANDKWNAIKSTLVSIWDTLKTGASEKWAAIKSDISNAWESIKTASISQWNTIKSTLTTTWQNIKSNCSTAFNVVKNTVTNAWDSLKNALKNFGSWLSGTFANTWNNAWNKIVNGFGTIFNGIKSKVKGPINAVIGFLNNLISKVESAINKIINGINKALTISTPKITLPFGAGEWGGWSWSPGLETVSWGRIKELASGGILDKPTLFGMLGNTKLMGGEAGNEAVLPLENHTEWMDALADRVTNKAAQNNMSFAPYMNGAGTGGDSMEVLAEYVRIGIESAVSRVTDMMRQQNEYLRQINDKEWTTEVSTYAINNANRRTNRRAGTTIVAVGT